MSEFTLGLVYPEPVEGVEGSMGQRGSQKSKVAGEENTGIIKPEGQIALVPLEDHDSPLETDNSKPT